jgi:predicted glycosyltransferase
MRTCWVFDHPAHVRLLAPFLRSGTATDVIVATNRHEVRKLMESSEGVLPRRQIIWVERPVGKGRLRIAWKRMRTVRQELRKAAKNWHRFERIVSVGASLELRVAKKLNIPKRWYISDTEINHLAHQLAKNAATDAIFPIHWDESIDDGWIKKFNQKKVNIQRLDGLHGHVHLRPQLRPVQVQDPPSFVVRRLQGDGIHDSDEVLEIPQQILEGIEITYADESKYTGDPWQFITMLSRHNAVITQSVTVASESVLMGVPTLLVSNAKRGFLDRLESDGYPLFRLTSQSNVEEIQAQFLAGLFLTEALDLPEWPDAKQQFAEFIGSELID